MKQSKRKVKQGRAMKLMPLLALAAAFAAAGWHRYAPHIDPAQTGTALTVNTLADHDDGVCGANDCTLREAIAFASTLTGSPEITFDPTVFPPAGANTITLGGLELTIGHDLVITGPGSDVVTLDGHNGQAIFHITSGATVTLSGLTIANGRGGNGAGIINGGTLTVTNSNFSNNNGFQGGGIYSSGTLTVVGSTFSGNDGNDGGGGIYSTGTGTLTVTNSTFTANTSYGGGGINNRGTLTMMGSTFSGNRAVAGDGGGVDNNGGTMTVANSTFSGNSANGYGGGIMSKDGSLTVTSSTFSGNIASSATNAGGALCNYNGTLNLRNTLLAGSTGFNLTNIVGGGIINSLGHNLSDDDAEGGDAATTPGGDLNGAGDIRNTNPLLDTNGLQNNGGPTQTIALLPGSLALDTGDDSVLTANGGTLDYDQRGSGFPRKSGGHVDIGAFEHSNRAPVAANQSVTAYRNTALVVTLTVTDLDGDPLTYKITSLPAHGSLFDGSTPITATPFTLSGNTVSYVPATNFNGNDHFNFLANDGAVDSGMATVNIDVAEVLSLVVTTTGESNTHDNLTSLREAIDYANSGNAGATPVITFAANVTGTITQSGFDINHTVTINGPGAGLLIYDGNQDGNSIFHINSGTVTISGLTVTNTDSEHGGIDVQAGSLNLNDSIVTGCYNGSSGSAIYNKGVLTVTRSLITGNTTEVEPADGLTGGGGIYSEGGSVTIADSTISDNTATIASGGGVFCTGSPLTIVNSTISGNWADANGGGIFTNGSLTISNSNIRDNTANASYDAFGGGGLYSSFQQAIITNSTFFGNYSPDLGGGIYKLGGLSLVNCTLISNGAGLGGGGLYSIRATVINTIIVGNDNGNMEGALTAASGHNLIGGDITTIVDGLADNGGPTLTCALKPDSPASDAGDDAVLGAPYSLTTDQRGAGFPRKAHGHVDIGAYEEQTNIAPVATAQSVTTSQNNNVTITLAGTDADGDAITFTIATLPAHGDLYNGADATGHHIVAGDLPYVLTGNQVTYVPTILGANSFTFKANDSIVNSAPATMSLTVTEALSLIVTTASDFSTNSDSLTSLREAIAYANSGNAGASPTISFDSTVFAPAGGPYTISSSSELAITHNLTITGPGASVLKVDANTSHRVVRTTNVTVALSGLTIARGSLFGPGAGINNGGSLTMTNCVIASNRAGNNSGGGIYNTGTATLANCTLSGNSANGGGGIYNDTGGAATLTNCYLQGNMANFGGGITNTGTVTLTNCTLAGNTIGLGGGIYNTGTATLANCTLSGNSANGGGGIYNDTGGAATLTNCTLSGNTGGSGGGIVQNGTSSVSLCNTILANTSNFLGTATSLGHNLSSDATGPSGATDLRSTNPKFATSLNSNGGPTQTYALQAGSPAIDGGDDSVLGAPFSLTTDQRGAGFPRKHGSHVDIGAYELENLAPVATAQSVTTSLNTNVTITLAGTDADNDALTFAVTSLPVHGVLYAGANTSGHQIATGELTYTLTGNQVTYLPTTGYTGSDIFNFVVNDGTVASATAAVSLTVAADTTPPTVTIATPAAGSIAPNALTAINGTTSDSGSGVKRVEFSLYYYVGGTPQFWNISGGVGSFGGFDSVKSLLAVTINAPVAGVSNWHTTAPLPANLDNGSYTIRARGVDNSGNTSAYTTTGVSVAVSPSATVAATLTGRALTLSGTATANGGIQRLDLNLFYYSGGAPLFWNVTSGVGSFGAYDSVKSKLAVTFDPPVAGVSNWHCTAPLPTALANGSYTMRVQAIGANNTAGPLTTTPLNVAITPAVTVDKTLAGNALTGLLGTVTDNAGGLVGINRVELSLYYFVGGVAQYWNINGGVGGFGAYDSVKSKLAVTIDAPVAGVSNWHTTAPLPANLANGTYIARAQAFDSSGVASALTSISFTVAATPSLTVGKTVAGNDVTGLLGTATDNRGGAVGIQSIELSLYGFTGGVAQFWNVSGGIGAFGPFDGVHSILAVAIDPPTAGVSNWHCTDPLPTGLADGTYTMRARVKDNNGVISAYTTGTITVSAHVAHVVRQGVVGGVVLSSATVRESNVLLMFTGTIDAIAARDLTHYAIVVNGIPMALDGVTASKSTIAISLPSLQAGDRVQVSWHGLRDGAGKAIVDGGTPAITAH